MAEIVCGVTGLTAGEGVGLYFGIADGDLSVTELKEAIKGSGPFGPNDVVNEAIAERFVMWTGQTPVNRDNGTVLTFVNEFGGYLMEAKPRWTFARTKSWNWFVYNLGNAPTTGASIRLRAKNFGVWVT